MTVPFRTSVPDCCVSAAHIRCWAGLRFFREGYKCIYTSSILQLEKKLLGANRFFLSLSLSPCSLRPAPIQTLTFSERETIAGASGVVVFFVSFSTPSANTSRLRRLVKEKEERNNTPPVLQVFLLSFERSPTA